MPICWHLRVYHSPNRSLTVGVLADLRASEVLLTAFGVRVDAKCCQNLGNINIFEKKVAVARERWSLKQRRCSHRVFFSPTLIKPTKYLHFLSKSCFAYKTCVKAMKNQHFGSQNDPTTKYTTLEPKFYGYNFLQ